MKSKNFCVCGEYVLHRVTLGGPQIYECTRLRSRRFVDNTKLRTHFPKIHKKQRNFFSLVRRLIPPEVAAQGGAVAPGGFGN